MRECLKCGGCAYKSWDPYCSHLVPGEATPEEVRHYHSDCHCADPYGDGCMLRESEERAQEAAAISANIGASVAREAGEVDVSDLEIKPTHLIVPGANRSEAVERLASLVGAEPGEIDIPPETFDTRQQRAMEAAAQVAGAITAAAASYDYEAFERIISTAMGRVDSEDDA